MACRVPSSFFSIAPNAEKIDAKIESLKDHIVMIKGEIRRLKEYKNARILAVSKLPPEILSMILELLELGPNPRWGHISTSQRSSYISTAFNHLLPASQVCRLWRQVALDSPRIWGFIFGFASPRIVELFLERAGSAPLYLRSPTFSNEKTVLTVLNHLDRLREITLECEPEWAQRITSEPTPKLEYLSLRNTRRSYADSFRFPADAFSALQHLSLTGYVFRSSAASLINLRSLMINSYQKSPYHGPQESSAHGPVEFFAMLNGLPLLSSLTLTDAFAPLNWPIPPLSVSLPSLTHLSIQDGDISNLGIMSCITAPLIKTIKLLHTGRAHAETASPVIAAIYSNLPDIPYSRSRFELRATSTRVSDTFARVQVWTGRTLEEQESVTPFFDLKVLGTGDLETEGLVCSLCPSTSSPSAFHFSSDIESFENDHLDTFRDRILHQLKDITELYCDRLIDVTLILGNAPSKRSQASSLPSLTKIVLCGDRYIHHKPNVLSRLRGQLEARKAADVGAETWELRPRLLSASEIESFTGIIDIVELAQL